MRLKPLIHRSDVHQGRRGRVDQQQDGQAQEHNQQINEGVNESVDVHNTGGWPG